MELDKSVFFFYKSRDFKRQEMNMNMNTQQLKFYIPIPMSYTPRFNTSHKGFEQISNTNA